MITSRTDLSQGSSLAVSGAIWATGTGADIRIHTNGSNNLPALAAGEFFEVRDHSIANNNGLYQVVTVNTSTDDYECDKVSGSAPSTASAEAITTLGATGTSTEKSVFYDTAAQKIYLLEQGNLDSTGVTGQAIYSFGQQEWKNDNFLMANAPTPMICIDADAGKYIVGQDASGNYSNWCWADDAGFSIRTRKLLRNAGWNEVNQSATLLARWAGIVTLGAMEDENNDTAYFMFGSDTTVDNTADFDFAGPVNEAVQFYRHIGDLSGDTPAFGSTSTITRATGSFITDGFVVGGQVTVLNSTSNTGTYTLTGVAATTLTVSGTPFTVESWGTTEIAVNNDNAITLRLRVRDADTYGKTYAQANLASAGRTVLGNFIYPFPLANVSDLKIEATDAEIDSNSPYTGMSFTLYDTPQSKSGLVGGSFNFGMVINGNNGTDQQVFEWFQRQLRKTTDIDADADTNIGRCLDGMLTFIGDTLHVGSPDGGTSFPTNPDGGGSGVFIDNLNASSKNNVIFYDNTNTARTFPETISVTLDFNQILIDDTAAEFDLYYDRTIRTAVADFVLTASTSKITSSGGNLPTNSQIAVGKYIRVAGLTGDDAEMNGTYQISVINSAGYDWTIIRYDSKALVDVSSTAANVDQNCIDTPDAIIVHTDVRLSAATISFASPDTINDSGSGLGIFASGDLIEIEGTTLNDGIYTVDTVAAGQITTVEQTIVNESSGTTFTITKIASGMADEDFTFAYDFDGNTQGGRTVSTTTYIRAKAIGAEDAQYVTSNVQSIASGVPVTVTLVAQQERNYA